MILMRHGESEFNVVYKKTRVDPGIRDPKPTDAGRKQVADAVRYLMDRPIEQFHKPLYACTANRIDRR